MTFRILLYLVTVVISMMQFVPEVKAQGIRGGARSAALGNAGAGLPGDIWGCPNPASWSSIQARSVAFFASEAFGLSELRVAAARYIEPGRIGSFVVGYQTYGFEAFRENQYTLGYARSVKPGTTRPLHIGIHFRLYNIIIPDYGRAFALGVTAGIQVEVFHNLHFGCSAVNINEPKLMPGETLPQSLSLGFGYRPDPRFLVVFDVFQDTHFPLSVRSGIEMRLIPALVLRSGITTAPNKFTAGIGFISGIFSADITVQRHDVLGWSPAVSTGVQW